MVGKILLSLAETLRQFLEVMKVVQLRRYD
jgi:hypothetical protein